RRPDALIGCGFVAPAPRCRRFYERARNTPPRLRQPERAAGGEQPWDEIEQWLQIILLVEDIGSQQYVIRRARHTGRPASGRPPVEQQRAGQPPSIAQGVVAAEEQRFGKAVGHPERGASRKRSDGCRAQAAAQFQRAFLT